MRHCEKSKMKRFDRRLNRRVKNRLQLESMIAISLNADIDHTKENVYMQFIATVTKENDASKRAEKKEKEGSSSKGWDLFFNEK